MQSDDVAKDLVEKMGMRCSNMGPGLMDAYNMDFGDLLDDEAVKALMPSRKDKGGVTNGLNLEDNPVLRTFAEVRWSAGIGWAARGGAEKLWARSIGLCNAQLQLAATASGWSTVQLGCWWKLGAGSSKAVHCKPARTRDCLALCQEPTVV